MKSQPKEPEPRRALESTPLQTLRTYKLWLITLGLIVFTLGCSSGASEPIPSPEVGLVTESTTPNKASTPTEAPIQITTPEPIPTSRPAPRFTALNQEGTGVALDDILQANKYTVVLFYRGFF